MTDSVPGQPSPDNRDSLDSLDNPDSVPQTGEPAVDAALQGLRDLAAAPLDEHHERLSRVHEDLHRALNPE